MQTLIATRSILSFSPPCLARFVVYGDHIAIPRLHASTFRVAARLGRGGQAMACARSSIDTSDLDRYLGKTMGGGQLREPIGVNDIRRFVQGMQYANPLHYDADYAAAGRFGRIVAPQSFSVGCDIGHGAMPSVFEVSTFVAPASRRRSGVVVFCAPTFSR